MRHNFVPHFWLSKQVFNSVFTISEHFSVILRTVGMKDVLA